MEKEYQGRVTTTILLIALITGLIWTMIAGLIYDFFLRKWPIFIFMAFGCLLLFLTPHTAPSEGLLTVVRAGIQIVLA